MTLDEFNASHLRNGYIKIGIFDIYVRKAPRVINERWVVCLDMGNVQNWVYAKRGQGFFWDMLKALSKTQRQLYGAIYIENVANDRLAASLPKHGFSIHRSILGVDEGAPSFYMLLAPEHLGHGNGDEESGPDDPDCPCRATDKQKECALSGCGFCRDQAVPTFNHLIPGM